MIHPNLATMLAVVTTDYPLEPGEAIDVPAAGGRRELQRDLGRRRVLDERHGDPARERRERDRAHAGDRRAVRRARCARSCDDLARQIVADGEGVDGARRDHRRRRGRREAGEGDRTAHRHLAARQDRALRPRRELGPRADGRRQRPVQRRLRATRRRLVSLRYNDVVVLDHGAPTEVEPDVVGRRLHDRRSSSASATAARAT